MKSPRPDKTMDRIFSEFLAEPATCDLYQSWLKRKWPDHWRREYGQASQSRRTTQSRDGAFFGPIGHEETPGGFSGFRPHEVGADTEMMRVVGAVLQSLGTWLAANGSKRHDDPTGEPIGRAARDFRTAQALLDLFRARLVEDDSADDDDEVPFDRSDRTGAVPAGVGGGRRGLGSNRRAGVDSAVMSGWPGHWLVRAFREGQEIAQSLERAGAGEMPRNRQGISRD